jgi:serine-type D-Ala-D-Ala carboxypeptidase (penicillin-binding protein 5/6)
MRHYSYPAAIFFLLLSGVSAFALPLERVLPGRFAFAAEAEEANPGGSLHRLDPFTVPELSCRSAVLLDALTGEILFAKNPDMIIPPASMTKLVSLHILFEEIAAGNLALNQLLEVPSSADFRSAPPRSSLMFLQEGQRVQLLDIMRGLALPSGNDAAMLVAELLEGSMDAYVARMNREMEKLGFSSIVFADASGYSRYNSATAIDFARFSALYISRYPDSLRELHSIRTFSYPRPENLTGPGQSVYGTITQDNRNSLVGRHPWVDGLKTGYIDQSGYNVALTAGKDGRRLVAVLMGGPGENSRDGDMNRVIDGTNLLSYGFYRFETFKPEAPRLSSLPVVGGVVPYLQLEEIDIAPVSLLHEERSQLRWIFEAEAALRAPVAAGSLAGKLYLMTDSRVVQEYPVRAAGAVEKASFFRRLRQALSVLL